MLSVNIVSLCQLVDIGKFTPVLHFLKHIESGDRDGTNSLLFGMALFAFLLGGLRRCR